MSHYLYYEPYELRRNTFLLMLCCWDVKFDYISKQRCVTYEARPLLCGERFYLHPSSITNHPQNSHSSSLWICFPHSSSDKSKVTLLPTHSAKHKTTTKNQTIPVCKNPLAKVWKLKVYHVTENNSRLLWQFSILLMQDKYFFKRGKPTGHLSSGIIKFAPWSIDLLWSSHGTCCAHKRLYHGLYV